MDGDRAGIIQSERAEIVRTSDYPLALEFPARSVNSMDPSNIDTPEWQLVDCAAAGDRDARHVLFERHRETAYRVAMRITRRHDDALDVVQDGFIRAFQRLGDFQRESGFKTWLLRIVANRALDLLRSRKVRQALPIDGGEDSAGPLLAGDEATGAPGRDLEQRELRDRLHAAIQRLPAAQQTVFVLYATGELTYGEIAATLNVPLGTVMSRLYHARRRLHELLPEFAPAQNSSTSE